MINAKCKYCGGVVKKYDKVKRKVRTKKGEVYWIDVQRVKCVTCQRIYRILPDKLVPYKQYEIGIIKGVIEGLITPFDLEFEDYPSETTYKRWRKLQDGYFSTEFGLTNSI